MTLKRRSHYDLSLLDHSETLMIPGAETSSEIESIMRQAELAVAEMTAIGQTTVVGGRLIGYTSEVANEVFLDSARHADATNTLAEKLSTKERVVRFTGVNLDLEQKHLLTIQSVAAQAIMQHIPVAIKPKKKTVLERLIGR